MTALEDTQGLEKDRRISQRLLEYWETIRGDRLYPSEADVRPDELEDIWDSCFLVYVKPDTQERGFYYVWLGDALIEAYGDDLTGQDVVATLADPNARRITAKFAEVLRRKEPVVVDGEFVNKYDVTILYRQGLMPLSSDGETVDYILGGMKWKAV